MENCIFCKIAQGIIPSYKVYEDDKVLAFLDISQASKGHTLIIPKTHHKNFLEIDQETYLYVMKKAHEIAQSLIKALNCKGMNILSNANEAAGQTVMHFHVHLIPRYDEGDHISIEMHEHSIEYSLEELAKLIREA